MKKYILVHSIYLILLVAIAFCILSPGFIGQKVSASHDGAVGLAKMVFWKDAMEHGVLYPRWIPLAVGRQGIPTFVFYQPGFFLLSALFSWTPMFPFLALHLSILVLLILGMWGVYALANMYTERKIAAFLTAVFFGLTPYIYIDLHVRGSFAELMAMLLSPLPILCLVVFKNGLKEHCGSRSFVGLVGLLISLSCVMVAHPVGLVIMPGLVFLFSISCFFDLAKDSRKHFVLWIFNTVLTAAVITSFYWGPVISLKSYVAVERSLSDVYNAALNTVSLNDLFIVRSWGFGAFGAPHNGMLTPIGLPQFIAACFGVVFFWRYRFVRTAFFVLIGLIVLMLPVSSFFWKNVFFLRYFQFPWRLLSFTALPLAICFCGLIDMFFKRFNHIIAGILSCVVLGIGLWWYPVFSLPDDAITARSVDEFDYIGRISRSFDTLSTRHEVFPAFCKIPDFHILKKNIYSTHGGVKVAPFDGNSAYRLHYALFSLAPTEMIINQLYFPGWRLILDGEDIPDTILLSRLQSDGKIRFWLPEGEHELEAYYAGVPGEALYWILAGMFLIGFIVVAGISLRTEKEG